MKTIMTITALTCASLTLNATADWRLVFGSSLSNGTVERYIRKAKAEFFDVDKTSQGDSLSIYDGLKGQRKAVYTLPALKYDVPHSRERDMKDFERDVRDWLKSREQSSSTLRIPDIIDAVSSNANTNGDVRICFIGDPFYEHGFDDSFNFIKRGALDLPKNSVFGLHPKQHPFGILQRPSKEGLSYFLILETDKPTDNRLIAQLSEFYDDFLQAQHANEIQYFGQPSKGIIAQLFSAEITTRKRVHKVDEAILKVEDTEKIRVHELPPAERELSSLFICDSSLSNLSAMGKIAAHLKAQRMSPDINYGLILFGKAKGMPEGTLAYIHHITDDPIAMSSAFAKAPAGGIDTWGAFHAALRIARDHLRAVESKGTEIVVMADVAPRDAPNTPAELSYWAIVDQLITDGHTLRFVKSKGLAQDVSWINKPGRFNVQDL